MRRKLENFISLFHFDNSLVDETGNLTATTTGNFSFSESVFSAMKKTAHFDTKNTTLKLSPLNLAAGKSYVIEFSASFENTQDISGFFSLCKADNSEILNISFDSDGLVTVNGIKSDDKPGNNHLGFWELRIQDGKIFVWHNVGKIYKFENENGQPANFDIPFSGLQGGYIKIGGFVGAFDEFAISEGLKAPLTRNPEKPYTIAANLAELGGFGSGSHGIITDNNNGYINSYSVLQSVSSNKITLGDWNAGIFGVPDIGNEILIHISAAKTSDISCLGLFQFANIIHVAGNSFTLNKILPADFDPAKYIIQAVYIPHFSGANPNLWARPATWNAKTGGGILAARCSGSLKLDNLVTTDTGPDLPVGVISKSATLIDVCPLSKGGIIFIAAKSINVPVSCALGGWWYANQTGTEAGGYSTGQGSGSGAQTGANIILIAENLNVNESSISTGAPRSGGLGGACYIARKAANS